ncbi:MAG: TIGR04282 family arsenosugar biosynthesis glycosyltransferase [Candidatus Tectomicrobia bacterium]|nr:TIGR04282 family arsenosugar biosynthesis glycosyltransferase [Candidatus Tectomicrobia bacterium]
MPGNSPEEHGSSVLAIMAKWPQVGQVKTRLCPPLTFEQATHLYRGFLLDTLMFITALRQVKLAVAFTPPDSEAAFRKVLPSSIVLFPQQGNDLGERLSHLMIELFRQGYKKVVITSTDSPTLPAEFLQQAFDLLTTHRVVLGPCDDGGYYLIGSDAPYPSLFRDITWSTEHVLAETLERAQASDLQVALLPSWYDIDQGEDLIRLWNDARQLRQQGAMWPHHTLAYLETLEGQLFTRGAADGSS